MAPTPLMPSLFCSIFVAFYQIHQENKTFGHDVNEHNSFIFCYHFFRVECLIRKSSVLSWCWIVYEGMEIRIVPNGCYFGWFMLFFAFICIVVVNEKKKWKEKNRNSRKMLSFSDLHFGCINSPTAFFRTQIRIFFSFYILIPHRRDWGTRCAAHGRCENNYMVFRFFSLLLFRVHNYYVCVWDFFFSLTLQIGGGGVVAEFL